MGVHPSFCKFPEISNRMGVSEDAMMLAGCPCRGLYMKVPFVILFLTPNYLGSLHHMFQTPIKSIANRIALNPTYSGCSEV